MRALRLLLPTLLAACGGDARPSIFTADVVVALDAAVTPDTAAAPDAVNAPDASVDASAPTDSPLVRDAPWTCGSYVQTEAMASLASPELAEVSGVVESRRAPGVFFVHNDSGDSARFFAVDLGGALRAEYRVTNARAVDWEDIALGPCAAGTCVYLGDIGDNDRVRTEYTVYRVAEPVVPATAPSGPIDVTAEAITWRYPDGAHNAETLIADPTSGELYVVTKVDSGAVTVYRVSKGTAVRVGEMQLPANAGQLTGGDARPDGRALLLRTYARVLLYQRPEGAPFAALFAAQPETVASRIEPQGESVAWRLDGRGYVTISEGRNVRINVFACDGM